MARDSLDGFTKEYLIPAPLSKQAATELVIVINNVLPSDGPSPSDMDKEIGYAMFEIYQKLREFEPILAAELRQIETFVMAPKGIFDTKLLVDFAETMFSNEVREWLSEQAIKDIQQAGRCLAFELSTAAGFHLMRAVEDSIREYYKEVAQKPFNKDERSLSCENLEKIY